MPTRSALAAPIRIGVLAAEPIRVAGLASIFDLPARPDQAQLIPVIGSLAELTALPEIKYMVVDLHSAVDGLATLHAVRRQRADIRLIVIGPEGDDELVMQAIVFGARAYLGFSADPATVRKAICEVTLGSIWAPRRLLSRLIDRLLQVPGAASLGRARVRATGKPQLTAREEQVLRLVLKAQSTREIARQLGIEQRTVKSHIARLMQKAGVDNRIKLSVSALSRRLTHGAAVKERDAEGAGRLLRK